jgi:predicted CXXCH cytochrome family protein
LHTKDFHRNIGVDKRKLSSFILLVLLIALTGCSTAYRYKVLSFFFDGVPVPPKDLAIQPNDSLHLSDTTLLVQNPAKPLPPLMYTHPPYLDHDCAACHDNSTVGRFTKSSPDLCYQCHEDFSTKYKVLHGPVGGGQCTVCHSPHLSVNDKLLIRTGQSICLYCHDSEKVMKAEAHQDIAGVNCTECHNPHGGEDRYVLR